MESAFLLLNDVTSRKKLLKEGDIISEGHLNVCIVVYVAKMWMDHPQKNKGMERGGKLGEFSKLM